MPKSNNTQTSSSNPPPVPPPSGGLPPLEQRVAATNIPVEPPKAGDWLFLATFNESLIDKEWKLAGDRATLMVATQGFLFTIFFVILAFGAVNAAGADGARERVAKPLLLVIPIVGLCIILVASCGIFTAVVVARRLEHERSYYQGVLSRIFKGSIPDLGSRRGAVHGECGFGVVTSQEPIPDLGNRVERWIVRQSRRLGTVPFICITLILIGLWISALWLGQTATFPPARTIPPEHPPNTSPTARRIAEPVAAATGSWVFHPDVQNSRDLSQ